MTHEISFVVKLETDSGLIDLSKTVKVSGFDDNGFQAEKIGASEYARLLEKAYRIKNDGFYEEFNNGKANKTTFSTCEIIREIPTITEVK